MSDVDRFPDIVCLFATPEKAVPGNAGLSQRSAIEEVVVIEETRFRAVSVDATLRVARAWYYYYFTRL